MLEPEALVDWDRLRDRLREDLAVRRTSPRVPPWLRIAGWALFAVGWALVGFPLLSIPAVALLEALVFRGLMRRPRCELGALGWWRPPASFVLSPEAVASPRPGWGRGPGESGGNHGPR